MTDPDDPQRKSAVNVAVLVCLVLVAGTAVGLSVGSSHTTDSDFNAGTLDNLTVVGSGESAYVTLESPSSYNVVDSDGDGVAENGRALAGDNGDDMPLSSEWQIQPTYTGDVDEITVNISSTSGAAYDANVDIYIAQERPDGVNSEGTLVRNDWDPSWSTGTQSITLDSSYSVAAGTNYTVNFVAGNSDNDGAFDFVSLATDEDSGLTGWRSDTNNQVQDGGGDLTITDVAPPSGTYISQNHTNLTDVSEAWSNLTLQNASATVTWQYDGGASWVTDSSQSFTTTGNKTMQLGNTSQDTWRVNVTLESQSGTTDARLHDEGILVSDNGTTAVDEQSGESGLPLNSDSLPGDGLGLALFVIGLLAILLAAIVMFNNPAAGISWSFSVIALLLSGLLGIGLELFWMLLIATLVLVVMGFVVRWMA